MLPHSQSGHIIILCLAKTGRTSRNFWSLHSAKKKKTPKVLAFGVLGDFWLALCAQACGTCVAQFAPILSAKQWHATWCKRNTQTTNKNYEIPAGPVAGQTVRQLCHCIQTDGQCCPVEDQYIRGGVFSNSSHIGVHSHSKKFGLASCKRNF